MNVIQVSFFYNGVRLKIRHFSDYLDVWAARENWATDSLHTSCIDSSGTL